MMLINMFYLRHYAVIGYRSKVCKVTELWHSCEMNTSVGLD